MYNDLLSQLTPNTLILTVNLRLRDHLFEAYLAHTKHQVTPAPAIYPLQEWALQSYTANTPNRQRLLKEPEARWLWEQVIEEFCVNHPLLTIQDTASLAKSAREICDLWAIPLDELTDLHIAETQSFYEWSTTFSERLNALNAISPTAIWQALPLPDHFDQIFLVGFDDIPPAIQHYFEKCEASGVQVHHYAPHITCQQSQRIALPNIAEEIKTMALWANQQAEQGKRVCCVVPNLTEHKPLITHLFTEYTQLPFNISAGEPLNDYPLIQSALSYLGLPTLSLYRKPLSQALSYPFLFQHEDDRGLSAVLRTALYNQPEESIALHQLKKWVEQYQTDFPKATLGQRLMQFLLKKSNALDSRHSLHTWCEHSIHWLSELQWPNPNLLNSQHYQVREHFWKSLEAFATLSDLIGPCAFDTFYRELKHFLSTRVFQPQGKPALIQIMGMLETAGLPFDAIWIQGMTNDAWPARAKPNPLLPYQLQRQKETPHASAEREYHFALQTQKRFNQQCKQLIYSYPKQEGDQPLAPSQLIQSAQLITLDSLALPEIQTTNQRQFEQSFTLERQEDNTAPSVQENELSIGGVHLLKLQALCPFRAFMEIRLKVLSQKQPFAKTLHGIAKSTSGSITHLVLQHVFKAFPSQQALNSLTDEELKETLNTHIDHALRLYSVAIPKNLLSIEKTRQQQLIYPFLELEKKRPPFQVREQETTRFITIGPLKLRVQIDRIDELDHNETLIIDYKTGKTAPLVYWFKTPITEPQLPVYALFGNETSIGMCYAHIHPEATYYNGIIFSGFESHQFSKLSPQEKSDPEKRSWSALKADWQTSLTRTAESFVKGEAHITPSTQACQFCQLQRVCRLEMDYA